MDRRARGIGNDKLRERSIKMNAKWQRNYPNKTIPYAKHTKILYSEFICKLSHLELNNRLNCFKRLGDSWNEYLEYLKFIENLMDGDNTLLLLQAFGKNACPELAEQVYAKVNLTNPDCLAEADRASALLYQLRVDGRKFGDGKRRPGVHDRNEHNPGTERQVTRIQ
ncbi:hypothetical protein PC129_g21127 [Phytophthora cactorum]|uniref:Uncharacterized protein n=1 Tax=Phytophthora cactorum TaxID=29920 RepID=A0A329SKJ2_9STRA|nr:hypothetical protein Pcac1_g13768 [Phytophthora cactorum]KAG2798213.1 hypothetical protein PC112_g21455 [Phytophthora cactorum]KAG2803787.1 hypothetical protein PC111_g18539 [Phytophthora cactorum]KAG2844979.1 hypothetical protein PC113_g18287 [Phytophthora cactorum]KAG2884984.1 hypothetical protein PC114_g19899 [Phytophthora cactorum]